MLETIQTWTVEAEMYLDTEVAAAAATVFSLNSFSPALLDPHQLCDRRGEHHQFLVFVEEKVEAGEVAVLLVWELLFGQVLGHDGLHLQTHTVGLTCKSFCVLFGYHVFFFKYILKGLVSLSHKVKGLTRDRFFLKTIVKIEAAERETS